MKKSTAILWIAILASVAAVFCVLFISGSIRHSGEIERLKGETVDQAARIMELDADNTEKSGRIGNLSEEAAVLSEEVDRLTLEAADRDAALEQNASDLGERDEKIRTLQETVDALKTVKEQYTRDAERTADLDKLSA